MRSLWILAPLLLAGGCAASPAAAPGPASVTSVDALSGVAWSAFVRDCTVEHGGSGLGTVIDNVVKGDVNGDGRVDTLVVDECGASTSSWPEVVEVFDGASDPGHPRRMGALMEGDPHQVQNLVVQVEPGGRIVVTGQGESGAGPSCCPDLDVRDVFQFANGAMVLAEHSQSASGSPSPAVS